MLLKVFSPVSCSWDVGAGGGIGACEKHQHCNQEQDNRRLEAGIPNDSSCVVVLNQMRACRTLANYIEDPAEYNETNKDGQHNGIVIAGGGVPRHRVESGGVG